MLQFVDVAQSVLVVPVQLIEQEVTVAMAEVLGKLSQPAADTEVA